MDVCEWLMFGGQGSEFQIAAAGGGIWNLVIPYLAQRKGWRDLTCLTPTLRRTTISLDACWLKESKCFCLQFMAVG